MKRAKRKKARNCERKREGPQMLEFHPTHESRERHTFPRSLKSQSSVPQQEKKKKRNGDVTLNQTLKLTADNWFSNHCGHSVASPLPHPLPFHSIPNTTQHNTTPPKPGIFTLSPPTTSQSHQKPLFDRTQGNTLHYFPSHHYAC